MLCDDAHVKFLNLYLKRKYFKIAPTIKMVSTTTIMPELGTFFSAHGIIAYTGLDHDFTSLKVNEKSANVNAKGRSVNRPLRKMDFSSLNMR